MRPISRAGESHHYNIMNIKTIKSIYFIGIKGVGMSGLAIIAKERGMEVFGSDTAEKFITDSLLEKQGIVALAGFSAENISKVLVRKDLNEVLVVATAAHGGMGNVEAETATKLGFEVVSYGRALGLFMQGTRGISVAGTHGKTTTTALLAHLLTHAQLDPSYLVGTSQVASLGNAAHYGRGEFFVAEADEYVADIIHDKTPKFLYQKPEIILLTTIDWDHPDVFSSQKEVEDAFVKFVNSSQDNAIVIANSDDTGIKRILPDLQRRIITYGTEEGTMFYINDISYGDTTSFQASHENDSYQFSISLSGKHNVLNATAAILAAFHAGVSIEEIQKELPSFVGSKRRFEKISEKNGILFYDDYAHHPTEITATLKAFRDKFPNKRLIVLFQPHTFSRTKAFFDEFVASFKGADSVAVTGIFSSSREKEDVTVTAQMLVDSLKKQGKDASFVINADEFMAKIGSKLQNNDILVTMGAGDIYTWHEKIRSLI